MRKLSVLLMLLVLGSAQAGPRSAENFRALIQQAWPEHSLRADQLAWLAKASADADQQCRISGYSAQFCDEMLLLALQEQLGRAPHQASLWSTRQTVQ